jgi:hypothetical protein
MGLKPTTPVFDRAKAVHVLDRAATVIGETLATEPYYQSHESSPYPCMLFLRSS